MTAGRELASRGNGKAQETMSLIESYLDAMNDMNRARTDYSMDFAEESPLIKDAWDATVSSWLAGLEVVDEDSARTIVYTLTKALSKNWDVEGFGG